MIAKCPGCGAPPAPGASVCRYCNTPLQAPARVNQPARAGGGGGVAVALVAGLVIAGGAAGAVMWTGARTAGTADGPLGGGAAREAPNHLLAVIADAGGREDLLVHYYRDGKYHVGRVDGRTLTRTWESEHGEKSLFPGVALDEGAAYVAAGERLRALDLADGRARWDVGLVSEIQFATALQRLGDTVVAWQKDKTLQGFDTGSGAVRWTRRTSETGHQLVTVGGKVVTEAEGDATKFVLVDPRTGAAGPPQYVSCDKPGPFSSDYSKLRQAEATKDGGLVLTTGIHEVCVALWDPATAKTRWTLKLEDRIDIGWSETQSLRVDGPDVYLAGEDVLVAVDLAGGKRRELAREAEGNFRLRIVHEDTVIAVFYPDYDHRKVSLRGIGRDGAQRWQHRLVAEDSGGRDWGVTPGVGEIFVWQVDAEAKTLFVERIDVKTGELKEKQPLAPPEQHVAPSFSSTITSPKRAWFVGAGEFSTLDLVTGAVEHI